MSKASLNLRDLGKILGGLLLELLNKISLRDEVEHDPLRFLLSGIFVDKRKQIKRVFEEVDLIDFSPLELHPDPLCHFLPVNFESFLIHSLLVKYLDLIYLEQSDPCLCLFSFDATDDTISEGIMSLDSLVLPLHKVVLILLPFLFLHSLSVKFCSHYPALQVKFRILEQLRFFVC